MRHHSSPTNGTTTLDNTGSKGRSGTSRLSTVLISVTFFAILVFLLINLSTSAAGAASVCDKVASSNIQRLVDSLRPGQTGCLRKGVYTQRTVRVKGRSGTASNPITLRSYPGERAEIRGSIKVADDANYWKFQGLRVDASYSPVGPAPSKEPRINTDQAFRVNGDHISIIRNNMSNRRPNGNPDLAGTCILLGQKGKVAVDTRINGNSIHHCGQIPRSNHEHGIYSSNSRGAKILNNLVFANADRGIQLYPETRGALVSGNVAWRNAQGLVIDANSSNNTVRNNVFSHPRDSWNVYQGPKLSRGGNRVNNNCFWGTGGSSKFKNGNHITASGNTIANPRYRNKGGFKITNRACLAKYSGTMAR